MKTSRAHRLLLALNSAPLLLFVGVFLMFGALSSRFLEPQNLVNILDPILLHRHRGHWHDVCAADRRRGPFGRGHHVRGGRHCRQIDLARRALGLALAVIILVGLACGLINAFFITRLRIVAFVVTLATLYLGRGFALWLTQTRAMNLPESFLRMGTTRLLGMPLPIVILGGHPARCALVLTRTPFGRQIYAVGQNLEAARKAGIQHRPHFSGGLCHQRLLRGSRRHCVAGPARRGVAHLWHQQGIQRHRRGGAGRHQPVRRTRSTCFPARCSARC